MSYPKLTPIIAKGAIEPRYLEDRFADVINVKDFGAKGDAVYDANTESWSGTDDNDAINAAFAYAAEHKLPVIFPSGRYIVRKIVCPNGVPSVDGYGSTIIRKWSYSTALSITGCHDITIRNINTTSMDNTIRAGGISGVDLKNVVLENIRNDCKAPRSANNSGAWGLTLSGENILVSNFYNDTTLAGEYGDGLHLGWVKNFTMTNFEIYSGDDGISICQHSPYTGAWIDEDSENITISNGIVCSEQFTSIRIAYVHESEEDTEDDVHHAVKHVIFDSIIVPKSQHTFLHIGGDDGAGSVHDDITFSNCSIADDSAVRNAYIPEGTNVGTIIFNNCNFTRSTGNGSYFDIWGNVGFFSMNGCRFVDTWENIEEAVENKDFLLDHVVNIEIKNSYFSELHKGHIFMIAHASNVYFANNRFYIRDSDAWDAIQLTNMPANACIRMMGNLFAGGTRNLYITPEDSTVTEFISIGNVYSGFVYILYNLTVTGRRVVNDFYRGKVTIDTNIEPWHDNAVNVGSASKRFATIYAGTGTINTSDAREKDNLFEPDDALFRAWEKVRFKVFQFKDALERKGENARLHVGVIAQAVSEAFASEGLDASRYGLFCYDSWDAEYSDVEVVDVEPVLDENGNVVSPAQKHVEQRLVQSAGDRYGVRYEEALALECAYQRWRLEQLEERVNQLTDSNN